MWHTLLWWRVKEREREMFSHHLRFSSNPRASPRRKQIVFDKPPCFVQPSWWVSLHSRCTIIRSKIIFFFFALFSSPPPFPPSLPGRQALLLLTCLSQKGLQISSDCLVFHFIKKDQDMVACSVYICMCASAKSACDYHAIRLASIHVHAHFAYAFLDCMSGSMEESHKC